MNSVVATQTIDFLKDAKHLVWGVLESKIRKEGALSLNKREEDEWHRLAFVELYA
jgi:hypothetical protein